MARAKTEELEEDVYLYLPGPSQYPGPPGPSTSSAKGSTSPQRNPPSALARSSGRLIVAHNSPLALTVKGPLSLIQRSIFPSTSCAFFPLPSPHRVSVPPESPNPDSQTTQVASQPKTSQQVPESSESSTLSCDSSQSNSQKPRARKRKAAPDAEAPQRTRSSRIRQKEEEKKLKDKLAERAKRRKISK
ncbi:hypothetical protein FRC03_003266 [Tulasnella sp. 419]|nr:hypothetical protein FRC03_003266 [Tulasnella sp. 419]